MSKYKGRDVLIFGLGLNQGGLGSAKFFASQGAKVKVTDLKNARVLKPSLGELKKFPDIEYTLGEHKYEDVTWADLIIKNPSVKPGNPYIEYALKNNKEVKMDMDIFLEFIKPSQIIGVTGTKGKSTTASLIYEVLKNAGKKVIFAGNIGKSVLDTVPYVNKDTLVVLEISSFQLESFDINKISPKWAVITNITPDHLNYYSLMEEYVDAKRIIGKYQTQDDFLFLRKNDPITSNSDFLNGLRGKVIYFSKDDLPKDFSPNLKGEHNSENIAAVFQIGEVFNIDKTLLLKTLADFKGIPFRMELIKEWHGIKIINDTAATSPESGIKALQTFPGCILICGGMNKRMDYQEYAKVASQNAKKIFFLEGDSTDEIKKYLSADIIAGIYNNFDSLLKDVKKIVETDDTVLSPKVILFSPAATSFNLFQNEWDRGKKFKEAVQKVFG